MNWLAHFALSPTVFELQLGNLVGDTITVDEWPSIPPLVALGIQLHHEIDSLTDRHPAFKEAKSLIRVERAVFKPVVLDILFDYHLHQHWALFCSDNMERVWGSFLKEYDKYSCLPSTVDSFIGLLREYDVLDSYRTYDGITHALYRVERRLLARGRLIDLKSSVQSMEENEAMIGDCFVKLYTDLQSHCRKWLKIHGF